MDKKKVKAIIIVVVILAICVCGYFINKANQPTWNITYSIVNNAGMQDETNGAGLAYSQTFEVKGTLELKNYGSCKIVITADAIGNNNAKIRIFTYLNIDGDGTYNFCMDSFYENNAYKIVSIDNIEVKTV